MKKETSALILLALLVHHSPVAWGQDDLLEEDFQTLMEEKSPGQGPEVIPGKVDAIVPEASASSSSVDVSGLSSETVDLEALEGLDSFEAAPAAPIEQAKSGEVAEPLDPFEALSETLTDDTPADTMKVDAGDDLEILKRDLGDDFIPAQDIPEPAPVKTVKKKAPTPTIAEKKDGAEPEVFDVGREERELLAIAHNIQGQISDNEWNEVATAAKVDSYTVIKNDWLFKISKRLFGSGYFYPKIWSLNSYITNPHFIEPGMVLSFTTGSGHLAPEVKLGTFSDDELQAAPGSTGPVNATDLANFGEDARPKWMDEKAELADQGVYFQYASEETMDDLVKAGAEALNKEYEGYEPPRSEFDIIVPSNYDKVGFDKNSKIFYSFKDGYYLSTFVSTNIVQDFGAITNGPDENIFFTKLDHAYIQFDESVNALPGDRFSVYTALGKTKHKNSDRQGYKYAIVAQIKLIRKIRDKWEVEFTEVSGTPQRGDRITAYTPKIDRITKTYNSRLVEAAILSTFMPQQTIIGYGDVIYLDRGRADGVEMGNVFEVYGFKDRLTNKNITDQPTYKMGELTVITLTDNFATALVTHSSRDFYAGDIAITKTKEAHLRKLKAQEARSKGISGLVGGKALDELDVELNLENLNDDLLKKADKIQLTEDELAELERQEREKSVIKDSERDLKALERLEGEIENAESILNEAKLDEDKLLEDQNLNELEKKRGSIDQDSLDEIEENLGKRYLDEDLNSKENPFGLTEFDVEEVDELLNVEKKEN